MRPLNDLQPPPAAQKVCVKPRDGTSHAPTPSPPTPIYVLRHSPPPFPPFPPSFSSWLSSVTSISASHSPFHLYCILFLFHIFCSGLSVVEMFIYRDLFVLKLFFLVFFKTTIVDLFVCVSLSSIHTFLHDSYLMMNST